MGEHMRTTDAMRVAMPTGPTTGAVPSVLHLVWVGSETPKWAVDSHRRWVENVPEGWEVKLWDDATLRQHPHPVLSALPTLAEEGHLPGRGVADLVRLWTVSLYGGVYLDLDTLPVRPDLVGTLAGGDAWLGERPGWTPEKLALTNAHFGFPCNHPFLAEVWDRAGHQLSRGVLNEHFVAGPRAFRHVFEGHRLPVRTDLPTTSTDTQAVEMLAGRAQHDLGLLQASYPHPVPLIHVVTRKSRLA